MYNSDNGNYKNAISGAEDEILYWTQTPEVLTLYFKIGGLGGSSTRMELAAAIIGISANGPVHVASDSEDFAKAATELINLIIDNQDHKKIWKLLSDGDLQEHFHKALLAETTQ